MTRWQYRIVPISLETTAAELDAIGADGWELAAIASDRAWLKRDRGAHELKVQADRHAAERGKQ